MFSLSKIVFWTALLIATVSGAAWVIVHFTGGYLRFLELAQPITAQQWAVLGAATLVFYVLDYARLYTLFYLLGVRLPLGVGMQLTCVSYFVSSLTPTAELNIPAMIFLLRHSGIPASKTAAVAIVKTFYMTLWVCIFGFATLALQDDVHLPQPIAAHLLALITPAIILILLFLWIAFAPDPALRWIRTLRARASLPAWLTRLLAGIERSIRAIADVGQSTHPMHIASHGACILFLLVYVGIGAYLCRALGIAVAPDKALAVFSNSLLVAYLAPVPGSIGVSEVLTNYFLDPALTDRGMVVSTLLRFLCAYVVVLPGSVILLNALRQVGRRQLHKQYKAAST